MTLFNEKTKLLISSTPRPPSSGWLLLELYRSIGGLLQRFQLFPIRQSLILLLPIFLHFLLIVDFRGRRWVVNVLPVVDGSPLTLGVSKVPARQDGYAQVDAELPSLEEESLSSSGHSAAGRIRFCTTTVISSKVLSVDE